MKVELSVTLFTEDRRFLALFAMIYVDMYIRLTRWLSPHIQTVFAVPSLFIKNK